MADGAMQVLDDNVVENARMQERFVFRRDPARPDVLPFEFTVGPGGGLPTRHYHAVQHEVFRCVSGELTVHLADGDRVLRAGESVDLPPGTVHAFSNRGAVSVVCDVEYRPAGRNEPWLKLVNAIERKLGREPTLLEIAPFIGDVGLYIEGPPRVVQVVLFAVLRVVATALGKKREGLAAASELYGRPFTWD